MSSKKRRNRKKYILFWVAFKSSIIAFMMLMIMLLVLILLDNSEKKVVEEPNPAIEEPITVNVPGTVTEPEGQNTDTVDETKENEQKPIEETVEETTENNVDVEKGPFSIDMKFASNEGDEFIVRYRQLSQNSEKHGKEYREDSSKAMSELCTCFAEGTTDSEEENAKNGWHEFETNKQNYELTGLLPDKEYEIHILDKKTNEEYLPKFTVKTEQYGFGDPFRSMDAFLILSTRDEYTGKILEKGEPVSVKMSSSNGCNNTAVKPVKDLGLYSDVSQSEQIGTVKKGSDLKVMVDTDGHYCYLSKDGKYLLRVKDEDGNKGWVNAGFIMVDVNGLFCPDDSACGIHINRTNAEASIFTAGGSGKSVDVTSDEETRYDCLSNGDYGDFLNAGGYNAINNVTGTKLANYGSKNQLPVIWYMALELRQCQKNALENGYALLIYEGYRPYSASKQVSGNLTQQGVLSKNEYDTNLAQGFLSDKTYDWSYYISKASRHNKGTAVDLTLVAINSSTELGEEVGMQTKMHTLDFRCNMLFNNWQADLLSDIMMGHGSNLECLSVRSEWWHFQMKNSRTDIYPYIGEYEYYDIVF